LGNCQIADKQLGRIINIIREEKKPFGYEVPVRGKIRKL